MVNISMSWVWAILLLLFLLAGFVFVIFLFLFALKKNFSLIGLCISGGLMAVFFFGFVVAGALSAIDAMDDASNIETTSTTQSEKDNQVSDRKSTRLNSSHVSI